MKTTLALLVSLLFLTSAYSEEHGRDSLVQAITSFNWTWKNKVANGPDQKSVEELQFHRDGRAQNLQYWTAHWEVTGPRTLVMILDGQRAYIVFDKDYTHYTGFDFNGETTVSGIRQNPR